ncbi:MAG TPA: acyltransferase [Rhizomicrobium sp.]|jgi:peptidoglycan/LPS O-acetylase OafA/YrhL
MADAAPIPKTFQTIQYLRGLGAIVVVLYHSVSQLQRFQPALFWPEWGALAVDAFLVISGFAMWHMISLRPFTPASFYRNRLLRIVPFYWAMTSVVVAVMLIAPWLLSSSQFDAAHVLASYFFVPWQHPVEHGMILPVLIPGWTLQFDLPFYILVGLCLFLPSRFRFAAMLVPLLVLAALPAFVHSSATAFVFYTQPIVLELASGVFLGWLLWRGVRVPAPVALAAVIAGIAVLPLLPSPTNVVPQIGAYQQMLQRELFYLVPAFAVVGGCVFFETARPLRHPVKAVLFLGEISYALYLSHPLVLPAVTKVWKALGLVQDGAANLAYLAIAMAATIAAAYVCYAWIERPLTRMFSQKQPHSVRTSGLTARIRQILRPA